MKRRVRYGIAALLVNAGGLAIVLAALALGAGGRRWGPTAAFLAIGTAAALCAELIHRRARRRARRQAGADVPRGVRLHRPFWLTLDESLAIVDFGCPLAAAAAALGFAGVGIGILLTMCLLPAFMAVTSLISVSAEDLTFEDDGLRVHLRRRSSFLIRWSAIAAVDREGPSERALTHLELLETASAVASVHPDTARNRRDVAIATWDGNQPGGKLTLVGWTAGLDAPVLARAIREAIGIAPDRPN